MIRIQQLKLNLNHNDIDIKKNILRLLKINEQELLDYKIIKKSIDARKKNSIFVVYTIDVKVNKEKNIIRKVNGNNVMLTKEKKYNFQVEGTEPLKERPVIIGTGPAGLFCALMLAEKGYKPIVFERGKAVDDRIKDVQLFWKTGKLNTNSNVQFGEGGAGTFSDGKLNTMVKDEFGRNHKVLETFVEAFAPPEILYINKPHIGTDLLVTVVKNIRKRIIELGGEIYFDNQLTNINIENNRLKSIEINNNKIIPCSILVLAIGHSARDTFDMLLKNNLDISSKSFAVGVRIEHPQEMISRHQYGDNYKNSHLPVAEYKLTHKCSNGRGVYSFCMCPGGFVVNAASEEKAVVTNGMSNYKRDEANANSAIIVTIYPEDFATSHPLSGVEFQRKLENNAYLLGGENYNIPIQTFKDFCHNKETVNLGNVIPNLKGYSKLSNLANGLPDFVYESLKEGIQAFDKKINGFAREDAILSGYETRTSSPIRINRSEQFESNIKGIYPCGEGAGYAGGITSAAMDGIKVAEAIMRVYKPLE